MIARTLAAAALFVALGAALAQPPKPADKPDIPKLLATRVGVDKFDGTFGDAVKLLAEKYELPVVVHPRLGEDDAFQACGAPANDQNVTLPKLASVRLDTVVKLLAEQVKGKFLMYPDYVKIVPAAFAEYESGVLAAGTDPADQPLLAPEDLVRTKPLIKRALVNASFKNKPLDEVLGEIAEATGANIAVSPQLPADVRQAPVTVRFANTPVDAAVRTLCEMTGAGVIEDANVLLVTTTDRAAARAKEEAQKRKDSQPPAFVGFGGGGVGVPFGAVPNDTAAELAKLKEQNEQLTKQLVALARDGRGASEGREEAG